jgi:hypothetical protein
MIDFVINNTLIQGFRATLWDWGWGSSKQGKLSFLRILEKSTYRKSQVQKKNCIAVNK